MKFKPNLVKQMQEEFQKTPNIRYVCNKLGLNHSTYYRWISRHHEFYKLVTASLEIGRDRICDAAEGVIISGIQNNDRKCATYWLAHNSPRYSSPKQAEYLAGATDRVIEVTNEPTPKGDPTATFEDMFELYYLLEDHLGVEKGRKRIEPLVKLLCYEDPDFEEVFFNTYQEWKNKKDEHEKRSEAADPRKRQP